MSVRAKFKVDSITRRKHWDATRDEIHDIRMSPVCSGSKENEAFYAASPSGDITLGCCNADAVKQFELGKEYYIDFTPANPS